MLKDGASRAHKAYDGAMKHRHAAKTVTLARIKTAKVGNDMREAQRELHEANADLADSATVGSVVTAESVRAALVQNINVEAQLHEAVEELRVVTDLLKTAEDDKAKLEQAVTAGHRSGEGLESVIAHLPIAPKALGPDVT